MKGKITLDDLKLDWDKVINVICSFINDTVTKSGAKGVVVGLSGGIDSSVTATLCAKALGSDRVYGLIMPDTTVTPEADVNDASDIAERLGIRDLTAGLDDEGGIRATFEDLKKLLS